MEGKFYRFKTPNHPHTNMAKAAQRMLKGRSLPASHAVQLTPLTTPACLITPPLPGALRAPYIRGQAALNMMTRTCADDLARDGVYMNSVDTGWINDENPVLLPPVLVLRMHRTAG